MGKPCTEKQKFATYEEAKVFADEYDNNIVMSFHVVAPYWCENHSSWHIGHDKFQRKSYPLPNI